MHKQKAGKLKADIGLQRVPSLKGVRAVAKEQKAAFQDLITLW